MKKSLISYQKSKNENIEKLMLKLRDYLTTGTSDNDVSQLNILLMEMEARKIRNNIFNAEIFGEASWDILLDLYYSHINGKIITVSSVCIASAVPPTTALRHLQIMQDLGYIQRSKDINDARKTIIQLTEKSLKLMEAWVTEVELRIFSQ